MQLLHSLLFGILLSTFWIAVSAQTLTGEIVSCSGWALNLYPELKSFIKDGEAESYEGVTVRFVPGRTAIMTIYQDGKEKEKVVMHELKSKQDMHKMMNQKGFALKSNLSTEKVKKIQAIIEGKLKLQPSLLDRLKHVKLVQKPKEIPADIKARVAFPPATPLNPNGQAVSVSEEEEKQKLPPDAASAAAGTSISRMSPISPEPENDPSRLVRTPEFAKQLQMVMVLVVGISVVGLVASRRRRRKGRGQ